jgi:hypothetical protein
MKKTFFLVDIALRARAQQREKQSGSELGTPVDGFKNVTGTSHGRIQHNDCVTKTVTWCMAIYNREESAPGVNEVRRWGEVYPSAYQVSFKRPNIMSPAK